jgi:hypothetical protein
VTERLEKRETRDRVTREKEQQGSETESSRDKRAAEKDQRQSD